MVLEISGQTSAYPAGVPDGSFGCNLAQRLEERVLPPGRSEEMLFSMAPIEVAA